MWLTLAAIGCGEAPPDAPARPSPEATAPPLEAPAPPPDPRVAPPLPASALEPLDVGEPAPAPTPPPAPVAVAEPAPTAPSPAPGPKPAAVAEPAEPTPVVEPSPTSEAPAEPSAPASAPRTWTLDPAKSTLYVFLRYDRSTGKLVQGHDHTVAATRWSGTVTWDPADPAACAIEIRLPVGGLVVDPPGYRAMAGLEGETPADDKATISENMWGRKQLEKDKFPEIAFVSTGCSGDPDRPTVTGELTLHGVTRPVSLPMDLAVDGDRFTARGTLNFLGSSYGVEPFSAPLGVLKNDDRLRIVIDVVGR